MSKIEFLDSLDWIEITPNLCYALVFVSDCKQYLKKKSGSIDTPNFSYDLIDCGDFVKIVCY